MKVGGVEGGGERSCTVVWLAWSAVARGSHDGNKGAVVAIGSEVFKPFTQTRQFAVALLSSHWYVVQATPSDD